jgi:hypothetical protein
MPTGVYDRTHLRGLSRDRNVRAATLRDRLYAHINIDANGCWLWTAQRTKYGYGIIKDVDRKRTAHRVSWELHNGTLIPSGMSVCHRCDVPACCNPDHLWLGTQKANMIDCASKGRHGVRDLPKGESHYNRKLTASDVLEIRGSSLPLPVLGRKYGVHAVTIFDVRHRRTWKHV